MTATAALVDEGVLVVLREQDEAPAEAQGAREPVAEADEQVRLLPQEVLPAGLLLAAHVRDREPEGQRQPLPDAVRPQRRALVHRREVDVGPHGEGGPVELRRVEDAEVERDVDAALARDAVRDERLAQDGGLGLGHDLVRRPGQGSLARGEGRLDLVGVHLQRLGPLLGAADRARVVTGQRRELVDVPGRERPDARRPSRCPRAPAPGATRAGPAGPPRSAGTARGTRRRLPAWRHRAVRAPARPACVPRPGPRAPRRPRTRADGSPVAGRPGCAGCGDRSPGAPRAPRRGGEGSTRRRPSRARGGGSAPSPRSARAPRSALPARATRRRPAARDPAPSRPRCRASRGAARATRSGPRPAGVVTTCPWLSDCS